MVFSKFKNSSHFSEEKSTTQSPPKYQFPSNLKGLEKLSPARLIERRLLGIEELGEYIGIRPQTIRNRLSNGTFPIPAKKVCGRVKFDLRDVESYLDKLQAHYKSRVDTSQ